MAIVHGFAVRCLFGVVFLHHTKQGRLLCAVSTHKSKNSAPIRHESHKSFKGQITFSSLPLVMGIAMRFWWEKLLKAFVSGQSGVRSGNSMTTRCVVNAHTLITFLSLAKSKHFSRTISGLSEGWKIRVSSFGEEMKPIFFFSLQLVALRSMKYNDSANIVDNYRPVQPLEGRQVNASFSMPTTTGTVPPVTIDGVALKISNVVLLLMLLLTAAFFH